MLRRKPRGLRPLLLLLRQARKRGEWPEVYDKLWEERRARNGMSEGTQQLVDVLMHWRDSPAPAVQMAITLALALTYGSIDGAAIYKGRVRTFYALKVESNNGRAGCFLVANAKSSSAWSSPLRRCEPDQPKGQAAQTINDNTLRIRSGHWSSLYP